MMQCYSHSKACKKINSRTHYFLTAHCTGVRACARVCIYIYIYMCVCVCVCVCVCELRTCVYLYDVCMYICMLYICMYIYMYVFIYICMYICTMYACMYVCMYVLQDNKQAFIILFPAGGTAFLLSKISKPTLGPTQPPT